MTAIGTDPMSTTLKRTPYYFPIGLQLSRPKPQDEDDDDEGLEDDEPDVPPSYLDLIRTFQSRYVSVVDRAVNFRQEDTSFAAKLSAKERDIYYAAHEATTQFTQWRSGKEKQTATIHATSGKRKRHDA